MGQQQSREELLYQQVSYGNVEGIRSLCREGVGLEWIDKEGKTPLIVACMNPELFHVAETLIELGANVNAYRPGSHGGTPLHHAAKRGLEQTVKLLLSRGANALAMNDDCQTPLDVARSKGYGKVVRVIESHICLFSGWMREFYGPGFLEALAPQWLSKKIWVVVIPCGSRNAANPIKLELAAYSSPLEAQPRLVISLWKANVEEPKFHHQDPTLVIFDKSTKTRFKFASANEGDKQQLHFFYNACKGIRQVQSPVMPGAPTLPPTAPALPGAPTLPPTVPVSTAEDIELAMGINYSIQSAMEEMPPISNTHLHSEVGNPDESSNFSGWGKLGAPSEAISSGWLDVSEAGPSSNQPQHMHHVNNATTQMVPETTSLDPSAPPIPYEIVDDGPIHYPSIDLSPVDVSVPTMEDRPENKDNDREGSGASSSCVICLDAPVEGACIPCGHMAGCMSCLKEIEAKKWGCPVCRTRIDKVIRLYAV